MRFFLNYFEDRIPFLGLFFFSLFLKGLLFFLRASRCALSFNLRSSTFYSYFAYENFITNSSQSISRPGERDIILLEILII